MTAALAAMRARLFEGTGRQRSDLPQDNADRARPGTVQVLTRFGLVRNTCAGSFTYERHGT